MLPECERQHRIVLKVQREEKKNKVFKIHRKKKREFTQIFNVMPIKKLR